MRIGSGRGMTEMSDTITQGQKLYEAFAEAMRQTCPELIGMPKWKELRGTLKGTYDLAAELLNSNWIRARSDK